MATPAKPPSQATPRNPHVDPRTYHSHVAGPGSGAPGAPPAPANGLSQFAGSDLGKWYAGLDSGYQKYMDTLGSSIATQRGQLDATLASALGSLGQRRDAAAKAYAALPGQIQGNDQYGMGQLEANNDQALQGISADTKQAAGGQLNSGIADAKALRASDNQFEAGLQPLLDTANTANYTVGQDRLNAEHMQGVNDLAQQQAAGQLQMQSAKMQQDNNLASMLLQRGWQQADAQRDHRWQIEQTNTEHGLAPSSDKMLADQGFTNADIEAAQKSPAMAWYKDQITKGEMDPKELYYNLRNNGNPAIEALIVRDHPEYFKVDENGKVGIPAVDGTESHPLFDEWKHSPISTSGKVYGEGIRRLWRATPWG